MMRSLTLALLVVVVTGLGHIRGAEPPNVTADMAEGYPWVYINHDDDRIICLDISVVNCNPDAKWYEVRVYLTDENGRQYSYVPNQLMPTGGTWDYEVEIPDYDFSPVDPPPGNYLLDVYIDFWKADGTFLGTIHLGAYPIEIP